MQSRIGSALAALALLGFSACGDQADTVNGPADAGGDSVVDDAGTVSFADGGEAGSSTCDTRVRPIFVLAQGTPPTISSFDPATLTFAHVQNVVCPGTTGWDAASMSVDRTFHAWIEWQNTGTGATTRLDRLDLATGACEPDAAKLPVPSLLGMAFVSAGANSAAESQFFVDTSSQLYALGSSTPLGQYYHFKSGEGTEFSGVELSGTGAGRLFMMIMNWTPAFNHPCTAQTPCAPTVHIGEVDKTNGAAISNAEVLGIPAFGISPGGFAFAQWGGLLWVFESPSFGPTKVYAYDPVAATSALKKSDGPNAVVGAGVSTCAPYVAPN